MLDVEVIEDPQAAEASLDPVRSQLLPELERHGLIELVEERKRGSFSERVMRATAASYVISPMASAAVQPDPSRSPDRLSARWMLAVASRLVRDVGLLLTRSSKAGKR